MEGKLDDYYALAGKKAYLVRNRRGVFSGRWTGFWTPPLKALDWFTYGYRKEAEEDVTWQCQGKLTNFDYDFLRSRLRISHDDLAIEERLFLPEPTPSFLLHLKANNELDQLLVTFQANLSIEDNAEEPTHPPQTAETTDEGIIVANSEKEMRRLQVTANQQPAAIYTKAAEFPFLSGKDSKDKSLLGGQNNARCLVFTGRELLLEFRLLPSSAGSRLQESRSGSLRQRLESLKREKEQAYSSFRNRTVSLSLDNFKPQVDMERFKLPLKLLYHTIKMEKGSQSGLYAGLPYYSMFFGRDTFWSCQGLNAIGAWREAKNSMRLLADKQSKDGRLPHEVWPSGKVNYPSVDASLLFIIAAADYYRWTADTALLKELWNPITRALNWADAKADPLFIPHSSELFLEGTTWMDSRDRGNYAVEVQALWLKALESVGYLSKQLGDKQLTKRADKLFDRVLNDFKARFWNQERQFLFDRILAAGDKDATLAVNATVPCLYGYLNEDRTESVLSKFESDAFSGPGGIRTVASGEKIYNCSYHRGAVWPFATSWVIAAELEHDRVEQGIAMLRDLLLKLNSYPLGVVPEVIREGKTDFRNCFLQSWSSAMILNNLVRDLFGIKPRAPQNEVLIQPKTTGKLGGLRIGGSKLTVRAESEELKVKNEGEELRVTSGQDSRRVKSGDRIRLSL